MRPAGLLLVALALWSHVDALVRPSELFYPSGANIALLPDAVLEGVVLDASTPESAEACAEECRSALPACNFFTYCKSVSAACGRVRPADRLWSTAAAAPPSLCCPPPLHPSCHLQGTCETENYGTLEQGDCLLLSRNCTLPADRTAAQGTVSGAGSLYEQACLQLSVVGRPWQRMLDFTLHRPSCHHCHTGFPIHNYPGPILEAFPTFLAQAIIGADFPCAWRRGVAQLLVLHGRAALRLLTGGHGACSARPRCTPRTLRAACHRVARLPCAPPLQARRRRCPASAPFQTASTQCSTATASPAHASQSRPLSTVSLHAWRGDGTAATLRRARSRP